MNYALLKHLVDFAGVPLGVSADEVDDRPRQDDQQPQKVAGDDIVGAAVNQDLLAHALRAARAPLGGPAHEADEEHPHTGKSVHFDRVGRTAAFRARNVGDLARVEPHLVRVGLDRALVELVLHCRNFLMVGKLL